MEFFATHSSSHLFVVASASSFPMLAARPAAPTSSAVFPALTAALATASGRATAYLPSARTGAFTTLAVAHPFDFTAIAGFTMLTLAVPASTSGWAIRCTGGSHEEASYVQDFWEVLERGRVKNQRDALALTGREDIFKKLMTAIPPATAVFFRKPVWKAYPSLYEKSDAARIVTLLDKVGHECAEGYVRATTLLGGIDALDELATRFFTDAQLPPTYAGPREMSSYITIDEFFDGLVKELILRCDVLLDVGWTAGKLSLE